MLLLSSVILLFFHRLQAYGYIPNLEDCKTFINVSACPESPVQFIKPSKYVKISTLWNNVAKSDEILNIPIYYKGPQDFSVVLTENPTDSGANFQTSRLYFFYIKAQKRYFFIHI